MDEPKVQRNAGLTRVGPERTVLELLRALRESVLRANWPRVAELCRVLAQADELLQRRYRVPQNVGHAALELILSQASSLAHGDESARAALASLLRDTLPTALEDVHVAHRRLTRARRLRAELQLQMRRFCALASYLPRALEETLRELQAWVVTSSAGRNLPLPLRILQARLELACAVRATAQQANPVAQLRESAAKRGRLHRRGRPTTRVVAEGPLEQLQALLRTVRGSHARILAAQTAALSGNMEQAMGELQNPDDETGPDERLILAPLESSFRARLSMDPADADVVALKAAAIDPGNEAAVEMLRDAHAGGRLSSEAYAEVIAAALDVTPPPGDSWLWQELATVLPLDMGVSSGVLQWVAEFAERHSYWTKCWLQRPLQDDLKRRIRAVLFPPTDVIHR